MAIVIKNQATRARLTFANADVTNIVVSASTGNTYMKIKSSKAHPYNAVNLKTGKLAAFKNNESVKEIYTDASITLPG